MQGRAGKGIKAGTFNDKTGRLVNLKLTAGGEDVILIADNGIVIRISTDDIRTIGRSSMGVRLMRLKGNGKVMAMALTPRDEEAEHATVDGAEEAEAVEATEATETTATTEE